MEKLIQLLSSPVFWSTGIAFFAIFVGYQHYSEKIRNEDNAIKEKRQQAAEAKKVE